MELPRITAQHGLFPVRLDRRTFHGGQKDIAIAARIGGEQRAGWAAVRGDGSAFTGWFSATRVAQSAAVLFAVNRALAIYPDGEHVTVLLPAPHLHNAFVQRRFPLEHRAPGERDAEGQLGFLYRQVVESMQRQLDRLTVDFPSPAETAPQEVPGARLPGAAHRLAYAMKELARDGIDPDDGALRWLADFALRGRTNLELRERYIRWTHEHKPAE